MSNKTTQQIQEAYEKGLSNITGHYFGALDELKNEAESDDTERSNYSWGAYDTARMLIRQATEERNEAFEKRAGELKRKLFGGPSALLGSEQARREYDEAVRTVSQQPWQVGDFMAIAQKTGNQALARAAFAVADETGEELVVNEFLNRNPDAREHYEELRAIPDAESRAEAVERAPEALIQPTESMVRPTPEAHDRAQAAKQYRPLAG